MERSKGEAWLRAVPLLALLALVPGCADEPPESEARPSAVELCERASELAREDRDLPGAIEAYRQALALDPGMALAHYGLGLALLRSGDAEGAAAELESALSLAPPDAAWRKDAEDALVVVYLRRAQAERR